MKNTIFILLGFTFISILHSTAKAYEAKGVVVGGSYSPASEVSVNNSNPSQQARGALQLNAVSAEVVAVKKVPKFGKANKFGSSAVANSVPQVNNYYAGGGAVNGRCKVSGQFMDSVGLVHDQHSCECNTFYTRPNGKREDCRCTGGGSCNVSYPGDHN